jgi:phosphomannomutase
MFYLVGVMVTASHNPKQDNGFKLYWSNGVQIIPPHDAGIYSRILQNLQPWMDYSLFTIPPFSLVRDELNLREYIFKEYLVDTKTSILHVSHLPQSNRSIAYTGKEYCNLLVF